MPYANISTALSDADKTQINTDVADILTLLPFLVNLTPAERHALRKMGQKREGYVNDVYTAAQNFIPAIPDTFDLAEYTLDKELVDDLEDVRTGIASLLEGIDDTLLAVGNELMKQSDQVYGFLKTAARGDAALDAVVQGIAAGLKRGPKGQVILTIGPGLSANVLKVSHGDPFLNSGSTVLRVNKLNASIGSAITLNPQTSVKIAQNWRDITVENLGGSDGEITCKTLA